MFPAIGVVVATDGAGASISAFCGVVVEGIAAVMD